VSFIREATGQSLAGNRDAFGWIVARYQSLLCSLAYSATGSLNQSEDLAQETLYHCLEATRRIAGAGKTAFVVVSDFAQSHL
jgi:DNA-directed RNA polymerase specialized sigma24 family protein